nr:butyrophilin subfamily 3 member A2-like [Pelodiscus sinensis]|eukprot:XP_025042891.1 butyrophilin subfamily 3 member A2-like [Pelodiscus sinensis]
MKLFEGCFPGFSRKIMKRKIFPFSDGSLVTAPLSAQTLFFMMLFFHFHSLDSVNFRVVGPDHPVPAVVGKDALLPCQLLPQMSAEDMEVRWFISLQPSEVIHLYKDRRDHEEQQNVGFRGRTELLKDDIANGSVALRIHSITPTDEGLYSCFFQSSTFYAEAKLELTVAGLGSAPHIFIEGYQDGGIRFVCQSSGWYPEPKMQWKDRHGQLLKSSSEETSRQPDGLFQTQISIVVAENSNGNMSCCVRNPRLNIEKESVIHIAGRYPSKLPLVENG